MLFQDNQSELSTHSIEGRGDRGTAGRLHSRVSNQSSLIRTRRTSSSSLPASLLHVEGVRNWEWGGGGKGGVGWGSGMGELGDGQICGKYR